MTFVLRGLLVLVVGLGVGGLIMWMAWSRASTPPPKPQPQPPSPNVVPQPTPPQPLPEIDPSLNFLHGPLFHVERLQWPIVLTLGRLAQAAYDSPERQQAIAHELGANDFKTLTAARSSEGFVASDSETVVISFRGTQEWPDVVSDVLGFPRYLNGGAIHHGFKRAIGTIYQDALRAAVDQGAAHKRLWITGHSLGGAIACGFSMQAVRSKALDPHGVLTFGQPLVMSESLCKFMLDTFDRQYIRIVNGIDPVTTLVQPYRHSGARAQLSDDDYDWRPPVIAFTAPPPGSPEPLEPALPIEPKDELRLMTHEQALELDRKLKAAYSESGDAPRATSPGVYGAWFSDPIAEHRMEGYMTRMAEITKRKVSETLR